MKKIIIILLPIVFVPSCTTLRKVTKPESISPASAVKSISFEYLQTIGNMGSSEGKLFYPHAVCLDTKDKLYKYPSVSYLYVADTNNQRIQRFDKNGDFDFQFGRFGIDEGKFNVPWGIAMDFDFRIYVSEVENNRIQKFDVWGNYISTIGKFGTDKGEFQEPHGICLDILGNLYVADTRNNRIQKFNPQGEFVQEFGSYGWGDGFLNEPYDVAADEKENIYVADTGNDRVQIFDFDGQFRLSIGKKDGRKGEFKSPQGIAIDEDKNIWVADTGNNRIQVFTLGGKYLGQLDGFDHPSDILVKNDILYVVDTNNHCVKKYKIVDGG